MTAATFLGARRQFPFTSYRTHSKGTATDLVFTRWVTVERGSLVSPVTIYRLAFRLTTSHGVTSLIVASHFLLPLQLRAYLFDKYKPPLSFKNFERKITFVILTCKNIFKILKIKFLCTQFIIHFSIHYV